MSHQQQQGQDEEWRVRRRQAGIVAFVVGLVGALAFFAFFPGLPHVIDWGAIVVSLAVGALARWACQPWMTKRRGELTSGR
ncbi:hypothetical protein KQH42_11995 [Streptomyces sp. CHA1]|uniref:hypothetical protein n=1 Tax=unclassified Streptomyces TaxID=2593676 RepID=UPI00053E6706|nr:MULTISPECIES: hypothetical protein [unclassified Streptomyces]MBT3160315.1 hypothetical protein [Streptomyces sp. G11C]MCO6701140.1 hypothetical protein [Streptomyces sp. CHB9.2]MCO6707356.1 hypothetical protein [Streptomyces sp. CHA3]MCO6713093.1 hypothetical protein [Streptomyces sp. CHB19.2]MCO6719421.1 hypothetical protein [Streptomyces sp. Vc714c-19]